MARRNDKLLLIVDGSNLAHRAYRKFEKLKSRNGIGTGLLYGFLRLLQGYIHRFNPTYVLVTFDTNQSKSSNFRNKLLDDYKGHRQKIDLDYTDFNRQIRVVKRILKYLNISVIYDREGLGFESDDYIALCALKHGGKVMIISSDKDFCQLVDQRVKMYSPSRDKIIQQKTCKEIMGYEPNQCVEYLSLVGDDSDDIPGYYGIGPKKAIQFLEQFGTWENFVKDPKATFKGVEKDILEDVCKRNYQLIDLRYSSSKIREVPIIVPNGYKETNLRIYFEKYTLRSFNSTEFLNTFKKIKPWQIKI